MPESIKTKFEEKFGAEQAEKIMSAALEHKNGIHDKQGSDPFKWALVICIGFECITRFREDHEITIPEAELKQWIIDEADLASHDGDCDYITLFCGGYQDYIKKEVTA